MVSQIFLEIEIVKVVKVITSLFTKATLQMDKLGGGSGEGGCRIFYLKFLFSSGFTQTNRKLKQL